MKFLIPEVIQPSALDCGPSCLQAIIRGHNIKLDYQKLRDLCQTNIDGSNIDSLEEIACELGFNAQQMVLPLDYIFSKGINIFPAIIVTVTPGGDNHFIVVWNKIGKFYQIMDPTLGRIFSREKALKERLLEHQIQFNPDEFEAWRAEDDFKEYQKVRLKSVNANKIDFKNFEIDKFVKLDSLIRMVGNWRSNKLIGTRKNEKIIRSLLDSDAELPSKYQKIKITQSMMTMQGGVLIHFNGLDKNNENLKSLMVDKLEQNNVKMSGFSLKSFIRNNIITVLPIVAISIMITLFEVLLFKSLFDVELDLNLRYQRIGIGGLLLGILCVNFYLEKIVLNLVLGFGRKMEMSLRIFLLEKIPKLTNEYFQTRLKSDLGERAHSIFRIRYSGLLGLSLIRSSIEILLTMLALIYLYPESGGLSSLLGASQILIPYLFWSLLQDSSLKVRSHSGALSKSYLDTLQGRYPIETHGAEKTIKSYHEILLENWKRAVSQYFKRIIIAMGSQLFLSTSITVYLVYSYVQSSVYTPQALLYVFWLIKLGLLGQNIIFNLIELPILKSIFSRVLEPFTIENENREGEPFEVKKDTPIVEFKNVGMSHDNNLILQEVSMKIEPGEHVAILGTSGAGKSTIASLILGLQKHDVGEILLSGTPIEDVSLQSLRDQIVWIEQEEMIWNDSLLKNILYGHSEKREVDIQKILENSLLRPVLNNLECGLQTKLGENGRLLSSGEAQRVRIARAYNRNNIKLAVFDEPFRGLPRSDRLLLLQKIQDNLKDKALIVISHDIKEVEGFDKVIIINNGKVQEIGNPGELLRREDSVLSTMLLQEETLNKNIKMKEHFKNIVLGESS